MLQCSQGCATGDAGSDGGACIPQTCQSQGFNCGAAGDGCGNMIQCGSCPAGQTCGGGGLPGQCGSATSQDGGATADAAPSRDGGSGVSASDLIEDDTGSLTEVKTQVPAGQIGGFWGDWETTGGGATLTPASGSFAYTSMPPAPGSQVPAAACISGVTSTAQYSSAAEGFDFATIPSDSGTSASTTYDASGHTGVTLWIYGDPSVGPQTVSVLFPDQGTDPRGGQCNPNPTDTSHCYDSWAHSAAINPGWQQVTIHFATDLAQGGWGYAEQSYDSAHAFGMSFQVSGPSGTGATTGTPFNFCVGPIAFID
jgi:hypothetical protein